ncbi:M23 family metallopeptidase [Pontibacillus litoralis]|uniref:Stage IV sporulation protein FA n=1 Tax=Pontibacillus litoralis JSM 072002 TaxID=1385512 RepID=A0A0A5G7C2_9BACI|nr:M23 family metallopeptidase [Pontibacillus litoralis]KGX89011.1 stage IV sporulation protein FA [Pontibacillus litoralis JSM 072002]
MKKDVRHIRKSIAQRKKQRSVKGERQHANSTVTYVQEEEKHGYLPFSSSTEEEKLGSGQYMTTFVFKSLLSAILFFAVAIMYQWDMESFEKPRAFVHHAVTEEFPFASVNKWYEESFGEPFAFLPQHIEENVPVITEEYALPVSGSIQQSFQENGQGIQIVTEQQQEVRATDEGIVLFAGKKKNTGNTVIIQHADGAKSYYGMLHNIDVTQYEQVPNQQVIGTTQAEAGEPFFFAIQQGEKYVDPIQVIQVDEHQ